MCSMFWLPSLSYGLRCIWKNGILAKWLLQRRVPDLCPSFCLRKEVMFPLKSTNCCFKTCLSEGQRNPVAVSTVTASPPTSPKVSNLYLLDVTWPYLPVPAPEPTFNQNVCQNPASVTGQGLTGAYLYTWHSNSHDKIGRTNISSILYKEVCAIVEEFSNTWNWHSMMASSKTKRHNQSHNYNYKASHSKNQKLKNAWMLH